MTPARWHDSTRMYQNVLILKFELATQKKWPFKQKFPYYYKVRLNALLNLFLKARFYGLKIMRISKLLTYCRVAQNIELCFFFLFTLGLWTKDLKIDHLLRASWLRNCRFQFYRIERLVTLSNYLWNHSVST